MESGCSNVSNEHIDAIFFTRVGVSISAFVSCFLAFILLSIFIFYLKIWNTFIHRLKFYLTIVAMVLSIFYLLQVMPMTSKDSFKWRVPCHLITFLLQYFGWVLLLMIAFIIVYLLRLAYRTGRSQVIYIPSARLEVAGVLFTFLFPLTFIWLPFASQHYSHYGIGGYYWCGTVSCNTTSENVHASFAYIIGLWYGPAILISLSCMVGVIVAVVLIWRFHKKRGLSQQMMVVVMKGTMPVIYLILYNIINILDALSEISQHEIVRHKFHEHTWLKANYPLWQIHAVTGPSRALMIPFAFLLGQVFSCHCSRQITDRDLYHRLQ